MEGFWPIFFLGVVLKIPVGLLLYLVWWAFRANTIPEEAPPDSEDHRFHRFRREPKHPRGPRRGPHGPGDSLPLPSSQHEGRSRASIPPAAATRTPTRR